MLTERAAVFVGRSIISVKDFTVKRMLGRGFHCTALKGFRNSDPYVPVVLKLFRPEQAHALEREKEVLTTMLSISNIPKVVAHTAAEVTNGHSSSYHTLIVTPLGQTVRPVVGGSPCSGAQLSVLVTVLQAAHALGIAHRDVKPGMYSDAM
jgi:hypothetical protein